MQSDLVIEIASVAGLLVDLVALYFLIGIWHDDRAMRIAAEKTLEAQLEYLGLRRKWYEQRTKKKDEKSVQDPAPKQEGTSGTAPSTDSDYL